MNDINLNPTSHVTAEARDRVLRATKTTRLVFRPLLVRNPNNPDASVKGDLVFQRKTRTESWEDHNTLKLSQLRAGEWVKFTLKSEEVLELVTCINQLYQLFSERGIPRKPTRYIEVESHVAALLEATDEELGRFLRLNEEEGIRVFLRLLRWLSDFADPHSVIQRLERLEPETLDQLNAAVSVSALTQALEVWQKERDNKREEFWQEALLRNRLILQQIFRFPIVVIEDQAYVGGKVINNTGGHLVDYLVSNEMTSNAALIEIKTPTTSLLGREYRDGIFAPSSEIVGAVSQVQNYKLQLLREYPRVAGEYAEHFDPFYPRAAIVAGDAKSQLNTKDEIRSFEVFRNGLRDVEIVTFDELFSRVSSVAELLQEDLSGTERDSL